MKSVHVKSVKIPERTISTICWGLILEAPDEARAFSTTRVVKTKPEKREHHCKKLTKNCG